MLQPGAIVSSTAQRELTACSAAFPHPSYHRPVATSLLMGAIFLVGLVAFPSLPVAPLPQVDFPTISVSAVAAGRQPGDHGRLGGAAARAAVRPDPRRLADDLDERARRDRHHACSSISTATSTPRPRTCRPRSTPRRASCRRTCRPRRPTARSTRPTRPILILSVASDVTADHRRRRFGGKHPRAADSQIPGVAQVPVGGQQKPAVRVQIDPAKLVELDLQLEDVRAQIGIATVDAPRARSSGTKQDFTILRQRPAAEGRAVERRHRRLQERRAGAHPRHRPGGRRARGHHSGRWQNGKRSVFLVVFKQPGANVIDTVEAIKKTLPTPRGGDSAVHQGHSCFPTAPPPSGPRSRTSSSR